MSTNFTDTRSNQNSQSGHPPWLDLYPSSKSPPPHRPNTQLHSRIKNIKETLERLASNTSIRRHLIALAENNGTYCPTCSPSTLLTHCSPTCPLLRDRPSVWLKQDPTWTHFATQDVELYEALQREVSTLGNDADPRTVAGWGVICSHLQLRMADSYYRGTGRVGLPSVRGIDPGWTFEGRWRKGPRVDAGIAPDEMDSHSVDGSTVENAQFGQKRNKIE